MNPSTVPIAIEMMPTRTLERLMRSSNSSGGRRQTTSVRLRLRSRLIFDEEDEAQDERERERGVGEDAERDVEREYRTVGRRRREFVADSEIGA